MSEKRFECVFIEDDEFGGTFRRLKDNETGIMHMTCDVVDLLNFQNTQIKILKEENEQLRKQINDKDDVRTPLYTQIPTTTTITNKRRVVPLNMRHRWY